jgi:hypothetical protein
LVTWFTAVVLPGCTWLQPAAPDPAVPANEQFLTRSEPQLVINQATDGDPQGRAAHWQESAYWHRQAEELTRRTAELEQRLQTEHQARQTAVQSRDQAEARCLDLQSRLLSAAIDKTRMEQELTRQRIEAVERRENTQSLPAGARSTVPPAAPLETKR